MLIDAQDVLRPSRGARLAARVRAGTLDRKLIEGADPATSPQLAARAGQLTAPAMRAEIAAALQRLVASAEGGATRLQAPTARHAIKANGTELTALAELLRSGRPLYARGLAMLHELVVDGTGPAYGLSGAGALNQRLRAAREAL